MLKYFAYGLGIGSNLALPELVPLTWNGADQVPLDVTIHVQDSCADYQEPAEPRVYLNVSPQETIVALRSIGLFRILNGREIIVTPAPQRDDRLIQLCISGSAIAILLYQRGFPLLLHASAINIRSNEQDNAVCFVGVSGAGKSSTAATLLSRGHSIVADDIVPIYPDHLPVRVLPGYPQAKVSASIATTLGYNLQDLIFLHPRLNEYAYRSVSDFSRTPLPLKRIYVLTDSDEFGIEPLGTQAAILELIRHTYGMQSLRAAIDPIQHLRACHQLLRSVSICRLHRPRSLPRLSELAQWIETDAVGDRIAQPALLTT